MASTPVFQQICPPFRGYTSVDATNQGAVVSERNGLSLSAIRKAELSVASDPAVGVWVIGARGSVATTAMTGAAAIAARLAPPVGLVTAQPPFTEVPLPPLNRFVFGGHDVTDTPLPKRAETLAGEGVMAPSLVQSVADALTVIDGALRPGVRDESGEPPAEAVARVRADIEAFRAAHDLSQVVVVNLASTEPPPPPHAAFEDLDALRDGLEDPTMTLPRSAVYAIAGYQAGCPFIDFTPAAATRLPALAALAEAEGVPFAGRDGKTGETLVKTALAPMFNDRALRVRSWSGTNLLGGGDGANLALAENVQSKLESKAAGLEAILGYPVESPLHIDYVSDLGEWKTAWDHITFEGFLGTRMRMQFTWEGCDSTLAAPLVLDLVRLVARAHEVGQHGALTSLAYFFKDPVGTGEHRLAPQFLALCDWVESLKGTAEGR